MSAEPRMPVPDLAPDARSAVHRPGCPQKGVQRHRNDAGVKWATCRSCSASWSEPEPDRRPAVPDVIEHGAPAVATIVSDYRCREHPEQPVNARGKGCPQCERERRRKPKPTIDKENRR